MRLIEEVLKDVALTTEGVKHYGRGAKAYANIESPVYPRIWIHLVNPVDTIHIKILMVDHITIHIKFIFF